MKDMLPVLARFCVSPEPNPYHIDVPDYVYTTGRLIAADLQRPFSSMNLALRNTPRPEIR